MPNVQTNTVEDYQAIIERRHIKENIRDTLIDAIHRDTSLLAHEKAEHVNLITAAYIRAMRGVRV